MAADNHSNGLQTATFTVASYNFHGWNQGSVFLANLCDIKEVNCDCIFVQELWLTPANLYKIEYFYDGYTFYGKSAMESAVALSVVKGRPFGGVGIL